MVFTHFFWDYDGTLYDTYGRLTRAALRAMTELGATVCYETLYPYLKRTFRYGWQAFMEPLGVPYQVFMDTYRQYSESEGRETMQPYRGVREMLEAVVAGGGQNYLYTHRGQSALQYLKEDGLLSLFTDCITSRDGFPDKPAPDALNYLKDKYQLCDAGCIMIGDRDIDLNAGKNAKMACALFDPEGYYPDYDTPYRFDSMAKMQRTLLAE